MKEETLKRILKNVFQQNPRMTFEKFLDMSKECWNDVQNEVIEEYHPLEIQELKHNATSYNADIRQEETGGIHDVDLNDDSNIVD